MAVFACLHSGEEETRGTKTLIAGFSLSECRVLSASQGEASQGEAAEESFLNLIGWWDSAWDHCSGSSEVLLEPQANRGER